MTKKRVIIIGAGFAGINAAKKLQKDFEVILINKTNNFIFKPLLVEYSFGVVKEKDLKYNLNKILPKSQIIVDEVTNTNYDKKEIVLSSGQTLAYDYLIISTGSEPNNFGLDISSALTIYDLESAEVAKAKFLEIKKRIEENQKISMAVIGGGPVGIEFITLAFDFIDYYSKKYNNSQIHTLKLFDAAPKILGHFDEEFQSKVNSVLNQKNVEIVTSAIGKKIETMENQNIKISYEKESEIKEEEFNVLLWSAGIKKINPNEEKLTPTPKLNLSEHQRVFTAGDCAIITSNENRLPDLAQTAKVEGRFIAQNIINLEKDKPISDLDFKLKGFDILLGYRKVLVQINSKNGSMKIDGILGRIMNRMIFIMSMPTNNIKIRLFIEWTLNLFSRKFKYI